MKTFDLKLLQALNAIISEQSFEKAADQLAITQSAISQRIKQLEQLVAHPVIVRSSPPIATTIGEKLLKHFKQVQLLQYQLNQELFPEQSQQPANVAIAVNADTLASWFIPAIAPLLRQENIELDTHVANEQTTQQLLIRGEVFAAVSSQPRSVAGCKTQHLGKLHYLLCASPAFIDKYFSQGLTESALRSAPAVNFDAHDDMHSQYLLKHFNVPAGQYPCHRVRSSEAFVHLALAGVAYTLLPVTQAQPYLADGSLINLAPKWPIVQDLYWHSWILERGVYNKVSEHIVNYARQIFVQ